MKRIFHNRSAWLAGALVLAFLISLIPVGWAAFYAHPGLDDYGFSKNAYQALQAGEGIFGALKGAFLTAWENYFGWQGTFTAIFLFALQPGVFSDDLYFITTYLMLAALIGATLFLLETALVKWLNMRKSHLLIIAAVVLTIQIQFVPDVAEGFFWYNGSVYYSFFYALMLTLFALLIRVFLAEKWRQRDGLTNVSIFLAVLIGGGNYTTCLLTLFTLVLVLITAYWKKHKAANKLLAVAIALGISFAVNALAPGNSVRAGLMQQMNPVLAVVMSIYYALHFMGRWTNLAVVAGILLISPLIYQAAARCRWKFDCPLVVLVLAFGCFACQLTPPMYAMSNYGSGRQINIYYYFYILMLVFDVFYVSGWMAKKHPSVVNMEALSAAARKHMLSGLVVLAVLTAAGCLSFGVKKMTSGACTAALLDGSAQAYDAVVSANVAAMEAEDGICYVNNVENCPLIFKPLELSGDGEFWVNDTYASYFGCEAVIMK